MKKFISTLVLVAMSLFVPTSVNAIALGSASIRMDRQAVSTAPGNILITASTTENVTENGVQVTVGSSWSIAGTAGAFTTSTSGLPAGVTPWPGIGTATNVAGNVITFPSGNVNTNTTYGFYLTGGIPTNPSSATEDGRVWQVATLVSSTPSSISSIGVPLQTNDQIVVTGEVLPPSSAFTVAITELTPGSPYPQGTAIQYQITYGSTHTQSSPLTVQSEWSLGTIAGNSSPSVDILEYVVGSASNAYGSTPPVIDTINRTITWNIASLPANTSNQTVTFTLRTKAGYTGDALVDFDVIGRITQPVAVPDETITLQYKYQAPPSSGGAGGSSSGGDKKICDQRCETDNDCDTGYCMLPEQRCRNRGNPSSTTCQSVSTSTAVPGIEGPSAAPFAISSVDIREISPTTASVAVQTNQISDVLMKYGSSQSALNRSTIVSTKKRNHVVSLTGLQPSTRYFFQVQATTGNTNVNSEIFTFITPQTGIGFAVEQFFVSADGVGLYFGSGPVTTPTTLPIPSNVQYEVSVRLRQALALRVAKIIAVPTDNSLTLFELSAVETQPGLWTVQIPASARNQHYQLALFVQDFQGNLATLPLINIRTIEPMRLIDAQTRQPVERARIEFFHYNAMTKLYEGMKPLGILKKNPLFSNYDGIVPIILPIGTYKIKIDALTYLPIEHEFEVTSSTSALPQLELELEPTGFSVMNIIHYYLNTLLHIWERAYALMVDLLQSQAIISMANSTILSLLAIVSLLALSAKTHVNVWHWPQFLHRAVQRARGTAVAGKISISGKIIDGITKKPISRVVIQFLNANTRQVVFQTTNYKNGIFHTQLAEGRYLLLITAEGYVPIEQQLSDPKQLTIELTKGEAVRKHVLHSIVLGIEHVLGSLFETFLLASLIGQVLFIPHLGLPQVLPFLVISFLNVLVWWVYLIL